MKKLLFLLSVFIAFVLIYQLQATGVTIITPNAFGSTSTFYLADCSTSLGNVKGALSSVYSLRSGEKLTTGNSFIGTTINGVQLKVGKQLSPTGTATIGIRNSSGTMVTSTTLDVSTLTSPYTSWTVKDFSFPSRVLAVGDRISIEYSGGDATNYIAACAGTTNPPSNANPFEYYSGAYNEESGQAPYLVFDIPGVSGGSGIQTINGNNSTAQTIAVNSGALTITDNGALHTIDLASIITKILTFTNNINVGANIVSSAPSGSTLKIIPPTNGAICIGTGC
jgi:hypothetical protein